MNFNCMNDNSTKYIKCYKCKNNFNSNKSLLSNKRSCRCHLYIEGICIDCGKNEKSLQNKNCYHVGDNSICSLCIIS